jgi:hypothetical protein
VNFNTEATARLIFNKHVRLLEDLEGGVDQADGRLSNAMKKMKKVLRDTEGEKVIFLLVLLQLSIAYQRSHLDGV